MLKSPEPDKTKAASGQVTPEKLAQSFKQVEGAITDIMLSKDPKNELVGTGPIAGRIGKVLNAIGVDTPEGASLQQALGDFALQYTKSTQGSRPSDFDLKFIRSEVLPDRKDSDEVLVTKLDNLRNIVINTTTDADRSKVLAKLFGDKYTNFNPDTATAKTVAPESGSSARAAFDSFLNSKSSPK